MESNYKKLYRNKKLNKKRKLEDKNNKTTKNWLGWKEEEQGRKWPLSYPGTSPHCILVFLELEGLPKSVCQWL